MDVTRATQESEGFDDRDGIRNGVADQFVKFGGGVEISPLGWILNGQKKKFGIFFGLTPQICSYV